MAEARLGRSDVLDRGRIAANRGRTGAAQAIGAAIGQGEEIGRQIPGRGRVPGLQTLGARRAARRPCRDGLAR